MKKNRTMRAAALLLALTLMTSCFVGGTFAKYTTSDSATDTARVAKWGVEVLASGNLFGTNYNPNSADDSIKDRICVATSNSVSAETNVVAPGTKNDEGLTVSISGTPEVSYETTVSNASATDIFLGAGHWGVMVKATGLNAASNVVGLYTESSGTYTKVTAGPWTSGTTYYELHDYVQVTEAYYPIVWTLKKDSDSPTQPATIAAAMGVMQSGFEAKDGNANVKSDLSYVLTWEWPFDGVNDAADTILGNLIAGGIDVVYAESADGTYTAPAAEKYSTSVNFNFSLTVEQTN